MNKQAKTLSKIQEQTFIAYLETTRHPTRNKIIFLLSLHGLRACEISNLTWEMITTSDGQVSDHMEITNTASKGSNGGRIVWISQTLHPLLQQYSDKILSKSGPVVRSERGNAKMSAQVIVNFFKQHYQIVGFTGCSSHSGRRTFITRAANKISSVGGSLRDIQALVGHSDLRNTQRYIQQDTNAQKTIMEKVV